MIIKSLFIIFIGFAGGLSVGAGYVAFLTVLGIIPRLTQLTKTMKMIQMYEWAVVFGAVAGTIGHVYRIPHLHLSLIYSNCIWLSRRNLCWNDGCSINRGINVWPILAKRIGVEEKIVILIMALVFGKIVGSLFQWIYFVDH